MELDPLDYRFVKRFLSQNTKAEDSLGGLQSDVHEALSSVFHACFHLRFGAFKFIVDATTERLKGCREALPNAHDHESHAIAKWLRKYFLMQFFSLC